MIFYKIKPVIKLKKPFMIPKKIKQEDSFEEKKRIQKSIKCIEEGKVIPFEDIIKKAYRGKGIISY